MRKLAKIALLLPLLLVVVVGAMVWGLVDSESGTRLLAQQARYFTVNLVAWRELDGTLTGPLTLRGLRVSTPGMELELETLSLDWQPSALLRAEIVVDQLSAQGIQVTLAADDNEAAPAEPFSPAALQLPLGVSLRDVHLQDLQVVQGDQAPQRVDSIELVATLRGGELSLQELSARVAQGGMSATGMVGLSDTMPLQLDLNWDGLLPANDRPADTTPLSSDGIPISGNMSLEGQLDWREAIDFGLQYRFAADGLNGIDPQLPPSLEASGALQGQYQGESLQLDLLSLTLTDALASLQLKGVLSLPANRAPEFDMALQWSALQWPLSGNEIQVASAAGKLELNGSPDSYVLALAADFSGRDIPDSSWRGRGEGNLKQLQLQQMLGNLLGGSLDINGTVEWDPIPRWDLSVNGHELDPGAMVANFPGQLAVALRSSGQLDPERGLRADFELEQLAGILMDTPLHLSAMGALAGNNVQLQSLELESSGNQINASGSLSDTFFDLNWRLSAPNPGALAPGLGGALSGHGTVSGSPDAPYLQASFEGENLQSDTLTLSDLQATVAAGTAADAKLDIELATGTLLDTDQPVLESLQFRAQGTTARHRATLELATVRERLNVHLEGGLNPALTNWRGTLAQLIAQSNAFGLWMLAAPSELSLASNEVMLGDSCLHQEAGKGQTCVRANWRAAGNSELRASLHALPLSLFTPDVGGELAATVNGGLNSQGDITARATATLSPGHIRVEQGEAARQFAHGGGSLDLTIGESGLSGTLHLDAPEQGVVDAQLQLPALKTLPLAAVQPLTGHLRATLPDLSSLAAWVPELSSSAGRLDADLQLQGTLEQPQLVGNLALTEGAADIPIAGLELRNIGLRASSNPANPDQLDLTGSLSSGRGSMVISGLIDLPANAVELKLLGDRLQVYNTQDAHVLLSPDLQLGWSGETLKLRGQLAIPEAAITPKLGISPAMLAEDPDTTPEPGQRITVSPDVVVINVSESEAAGPAAAIAPFRVDSQIQLVMGDKVTVNAAGFISRISGAVTFTNKPEQTELLPTARGRLSIEDGTFRAFGQDLDIETGQLIFADVPVTEPEVNLRAVRWIDNDPKVTAAGIILTGMATAPSMELFSRPQLDTSEVQSYLLTGRSAGDRTNVLSIGTYVLPRVYVGYGYNMLDRTSEFNSLFTITPRYGMGASVGEADNNLYLTFTHEN